MKNWCKSNGATSSFSTSKLPEASTGKNLEETQNEKDMSGKAKISWTSSQGEVLSH